MQFKNYWIKIYNYNHHHYHYHYHYHYRYHYWCQHCYYGILNLKRRIIVKKTEVRSLEPWLLPKA
jgi:hypothetical protein